MQVSFDFVDGSNQAGQLAAFVDDADLEGAGSPPTNAGWAVNSSGDWNASGNWSTGSVPNSAGVEADFFSVVTSPTTVYTNAPITAGTLHFNNANEYEITGTGNLTLQAMGSGSALVQVDQGTDETQFPTTIASNTTFNVASGANLIIANPMTINSGETLTQTGAGTVTYQSIITVNSNASIAFADSTHAHELSLASGATATLGGPVLEVDSLSNLGTINLLNNKMLINYGSGPDPIASIERGLRTASITCPARDHQQRHRGRRRRSAVSATASVTPTPPIRAIQPTCPAAPSKSCSPCWATPTLTESSTAKTSRRSQHNLGKSGAYGIKGTSITTELSTAEDFTSFSRNLGKIRHAGGRRSEEANGISLANVPEPMSAGVMAIAGLGILRRKRRSSR